MRIARIDTDLPDDFDALRAEAHAAGFGMLDRLARDGASGGDRYARAKRCRPCRVAIGRRSR
jgi:hypothetical protein